jgi:hypothetical protein
MAKPLQRLLGLVATLMLTLVAETAHAKCAGLLLHVEGRLASALPPDAQVLAFSDPDANTTERPAELSATAVTATLLFDATKGYSWWRGHDCSRRPRRIGLRVLVGGVERYTAFKTFPADFAERQDYQWVTKEPFHIRLRDAAGRSSLARPHNNELQRPKPAQAMELRR